MLCGTEGSLTWHLWGRAVQEMVPPGAIYGPPVLVGPRGIDDTAMRCGGSHWAAGRGKRSREERFKRGGEGGVEMKMREEEV